MHHAYLTQLLCIFATCAAGGRGGAARPTHCSCMYATASRSCIIKRFAGVKVKKVRYAATPQC